MDLFCFLSNILLGCCLWYNLKRYKKQGVIHEKNTSLNLLSYLGNEVDLLSSDDFLLMSLVKAWIHLFLVL